MCQLKFEYQEDNIPNDLKALFEEGMNQKYASVCKAVNDSGESVLVTTGRNGNLRGVITIDNNLHSIFKLNGLTPNYE
jgi:hypothetical protein